MESIGGYCVDSDILIDYLRGVEHARAFFAEASKEATLYISVASIVELYAGKETKNEEKRKRIEEFLKNFVVIPLDESVARVAGEFRRDYGKPFADMIVAASAYVYNLLLATRNIKHFEIVHRKAGLGLVEPY